MKEFAKLILPALKAWKEEKENGKIYQIPTVDLLIEELEAADDETEITLTDEVMTPNGIGKVSGFDEVNGRTMVKVWFTDIDGTAFSRWYNRDEVTKHTKAYGY